MSQVSKIDEPLEEFLLRYVTSNDVKNQDHAVSLMKQALLSAILEVKPDKFLAKKPPIVYGSDVPYSRLANAAHGAGYNTALDEWEATIKELFS